LHQNHNFLGGDFENMPNDRFLLIKAISHSIWKNVHHLIELLLVAELTERIPVIHWGANIMDNGVIFENRFDMYFEPLSPYSIHNLIRPEYTYYPPIWKYDNVMSDDSNRFIRMYRNTGDIMASDANVVVSDINIPIKHIIPWVPKDHPVYGMTPIQIYRYLFYKYIHLKPDVAKEIKEFLDLMLKSEEPVLAVHLPGDFTLDIYPQIQEYINLTRLYHPNNLNWFSPSKGHKKRSDRFQVDETAHLHEIVRLLKVKQSGDPYKLYHPEIRNMLGKYTISKIFLITDREDILEEYKRLYGPMLVYNNYERIHKNDAGRLDPHENNPNARSHGLNIIKDTYIASQCDFFIGYGSSNLSHAVTHLKYWSETNIKLTYWMFEKLYNFSYEFMKTGRYSPEESDGKYRLLIQQAGNLIKRLQRVFK
jgi:hypothetical protein